MTTLVATLLSLALAYGVNELVDNIKRQQASKKEVTTTDVLSMMDKLTAAVAKRGPAALSRVQRQLANIPAISGSPMLMEKMREINRKVGDRASGIEKSINEDNARLQGLQNKVASFAANTDAYRASDTGLAEKKKLEEQINSELERINNNKEYNNYEKKISEE